MAGDINNTDFVITEQDQLLKCENGRNVPTRKVNKKVVERLPLRKRLSHPNSTDDETKSQQFNPTQNDHVGFLRRTFSFQIGKPRDSVKLSPETSALIKLRYKDISKYVIWPDCALPEEYNRGYLTLNSDKSKRTAIRYNHAGNHQAAVLRFRDGKTSGNDAAIIPYGSPKTFPRMKSQNDDYPKQYITCSARSLPSTSLATVEEEQQHRPGENGEMVADIEDDRTPIPKRVINSVRRSESSDEDEPIVSMTSPRFQDGSVIDEELADESHSEEPDLQIWRF